MQFAFVFHLIDITLQKNIIMNLFKTNKTCEASVPRLGNNDTNINMSYVKKYPFPSAERALLIQLILPKHRYSTSHALTLHARFTSKIYDTILTNFILVINNLDQGWLIVTGSLISMEIHHSCCNIGEPTTRNIIAESHTSRQSRTPDCNRNLSETIHNFRNSAYQPKNTCIKGVKFE